MIAALCSTQVLYSAVVLPLTALGDPTGRPALIAHPAPTALTALTASAAAAAALVVIGWTAAASDVVINGLRRGDRTRLRLGLGLAVVASAHLRQGLGSGAAPGLLLVGLAVVLCAAARLTVTALREAEVRPVAAPGRGGRGDPRRCSGWWRP